MCCDWLWFFRSRIVAVVAIGVVVIAIVRGVVVVIVNVVFLLVVADEIVDVIIVGSRQNLSELICPATLCAASSSKNGHPISIFE